MFLKNEYGNVFKKCFRKCFLNEFGNISEKILKMFSGNNFGRILKKFSWIVFGKYVLTESKTKMIFLREK